MTESHRSARSLPVLVGVDGSASSLAAVDIAAREAEVRQLPLRVVHAFTWPLMHVSLEPPPLSPPEGGLRNQAQRILDEAVARARATAPGIEVNGEIITGDAAPVMLSCVRSASLVVIGDRGLGGFSGLLVGSVAVKLVSHSTCPVVVARGDTRTSGPVVVGVDGSEANYPAVGYAFEAADRRNATLLALHAWTDPVPIAPGDMMPLVYDVEEVQAEEERVLAEALAGWQAQYPNVSVVRSVTKVRIRNALIDASHHSQLMVVGARGRGGFAGLLLGSVSQAVLHHAACPVAIVPAPGDRRE